MQNNRIIYGSDALISDETLWYGGEPEIAESAIIDTIFTDILICGAGNAGMTAAIAAAKGGAKTLVIEKNAKVGSVKTYMGAVDTRAQKAAGDKARIDKEEIVKYLVHYADLCRDERFVHPANPVKEDLIRLWADESGTTFDFLADELAGYGITHVAEYDTGNGYHGKFKAFPVHTKFLVPFLKGGPKAKVHGGFMVLEKFMVKKAKSYGARFMFNTPLIKLAREGKRIIGAITGKGDGKYIRIIAGKGVLLCTGGYADDHGLFARLNPRAAAVTTLYYGQSGNSGDGIKAGIWAGSEKDPYPSAMLFDRGLTRPGGKAGIPFRRGGIMDTFTPGSQPFLKVNMDGKRFYNESVPYDVILYPLEKEKNGVCCIIWDARYWDNIVRFHTLGCSRHLPSTSKPLTHEGFGKMATSMFIVKGILGGYVRKANTIETLAAKLRLPPDTLKATVDRYNLMAKAGVDEDFGKPACDLIPLGTPPFYGATCAGWLLTTMDGLQINADMQVLDRSGNVIEGLYAAGDVAGGFFANNYYPELVVGIASGRTITFARHAVMHMTRKAG